MHFVSYRAAKALADQRAREAEIRAQRDELLRQAGLEPHGRLYGLTCRVLSSTGRRLVALGHRLEQFGIQEPLPLEGSASAGR